MTEWIAISEVRPGDRVKVISGGSSWAYWSSRAEAEASTDPFVRVTRVRANDLQSDLYEIWLADGGFKFQPASAYLLRLT